MKTHAGHKHKYQIKPNISCEPPAPANPPMDIYECALCEKYYDNLEELVKHAYCHIAENNNPNETKCQVFGHQFYDPKMLNRHNELYSWECQSHGQCLKFKKDECCNKSCRGAEHRVLKWYRCHTNSNILVPWHMLYVDHGA